MALSVSKLTEGQQWEAYAGSAPRASTYHRWAWRRVIEETYGHACHYLAVEEGGRMQGLLRWWR
jgi:hypothetical protein